MIDSNVTHSHTTPQTALANSKSSESFRRPDKRQPSKSERSFDINSARWELDPYKANDLENLVIEKYLIADHKRIDELAMTLRNERYNRLTPFLSTVLFVQRYQYMFDTVTAGGSDVVSGLECGLDAASLANLRHMWTARQHADLLGMEYDVYIQAVFIVHHALGHENPPMPRLMHGCMAVAAASMEKQASSAD